MDKDHKVTVVGVITTTELNSIGYNGDSSSETFGYGPIASQSIPTTSSLTCPNVKFLSIFRACARIHRETQILSVITYIYIRIRIFLFFFK